MAKVARVTVSIEQPLFDQFEKYAAASGFANRSEAVKSLMRKALAEEEWQHKGREVAGAISMVYDHHHGAVVPKLTDIQHDFGHTIVCTQHVHLDHANCMEVLVVRGRADDIRQLLARLKSAKGIKHSALMMATTGEEIG
ncbi:MAG: nickel-responsive transcriptional regulator NikR [Planctomycetota bacterium]